MNSASAPLALPVVAASMLMNDFLLLASSCLQYNTSQECWYDCTFWLNGFLGRNDIPSGRTGQLSRRTNQTTRRYRDASVRPQRQPATGRSAGPSAVAAASAA